MLSYSIYFGKLEFLNIENRKVINTINAYSYVLAKRDIDFRNSLQGCEVLLPDGFPIVFAARFLKGIKIDKIAGEDVFFHLLKKLDKNGGKAFFLGSSDETLARVNSRLIKEFPSVNAAFFSPPFKAKFSVDENMEMIEAVNKFAPDLLFVGMTAPKQEKWVNEHKGKLNARIICSIGAVFDFYAGTVNRPSKFWIDLHLEWFIRLVKEPKRLWKRYIIYSPLFFIDVFKAKMRSSLKKH